MIEKYENLYSLRSDGKYQVWRLERNEDEYRAVTGLWNGTDGIIPSSEVTNAWKLAEATNVGRANERNSVEQAKFEIAAHYKKRMEQGAVKNIGDEPLFPEQIDPMLAAKYDASKVVFPVWVQPKLDGGRCLVTTNAMMSRNWKPIVSAPHIFEALESKFLPNQISFDGELYNHEYKADFEKIMSLVRKSKPTYLDLEESAEKIQYWIYDLMIEAESEYDNLGFKDRHAILANMELPDCCVLVPTFECNSHEEIDEWYGEFLKAGYEGQMIRTNTKYEYKRTKALQKRKEFEDNEFEIRGFQDSLGNWKDCVKSVILWDPVSEQEFEATVDGDRERARQMWIEREEYVGGMATVRHQARTKKRGVPRFGVIKYIFKGKRDI
jgi:DNA ligase-1